MNLNFPPFGRNPPRAGDFFDPVTKDIKIRFFAPSGGWDMRRAYNVVQMLAFNVVHVTYAGM